MEGVLAVAAAHWNRTQLAQTHRSRYWQFPQCIRAINKRIGYDSEQWSGALIAHLRTLRQGSPFGKAISIGCGSGGKELEYLRAQIVGEFDLFEISPVRIERGRELYAKAGMAERGHFSAEDGLARLASQEAIYDLVLWDNSLHHMPNPAQALKFSARALRSGGALVFNEYVGPNRFQWSAAELNAMCIFRNSLPARFFEVAAGARVAVSRRIGRPTPEAMIAVDPTESIDSESILPAVRSLLPQAKVWLLGGVIYHFGLNDVLANMNFPQDEDLLNVAMGFDEALSNAGINHCAAGVFIKPAW